MMSPMPKSLPEYVCAHDPQHPEAVGAIASEPGLLRKGIARGAVWLPIDSVLERELRLGGFVKRSWGNDGWIFRLNRGEAGSPFALQVRTGVPFIHWAAAVVPQGGRRGKLQLHADQASTATLNSGLAVVTAPPAFELANDAGTPLRILRGVSRFQGTIDGFLGLDLYGVCDGIGVLWVAISQSTLNP